MTDKFYTPQQAALRVLKKTREMLKDSKLAKHNTSHEVELGDELNNEDADCPDFLADADIEDDYKEDEKRRSKKKSSKHSQESKDGHEMGEEEEEEKEKEKEEEKSSPKIGSKIAQHTEDNSNTTKEMSENGPRKIIENATKPKMNKSEEESDSQVHKWVKRIMGPEKLNDVLKEVPKDKQDDVMRALRAKKTQMKKSSLSKKQGTPKDADPETYERCVKEVKAKKGFKPRKGQTKVGAAHAVCAASHAGRSKKSENIEKANPDAKADAKLGEQIEHDVEDHMLSHKDSERKEGHKIVKSKLDKSWDSMVRHLRNQGYSKKSANKIAGKINAKYVHHYKKSEDGERVKENDIVPDDMDRVGEVQHMQVKVKPSKKLKKFLMRKKTKRKKK